MKYLIIIGSAYRFESEINIPLVTDNISEWKVYSLDHLPIGQDVKEVYTVNNTTVRRKQLDVSREDSAEYKQFIEDIKETKQSDVYVIDSISCGFISNFVVKLLKMLAELGCSTFFTHYISSFNHDPSFSLTYIVPAIDKDDSVIDEIMDILDFNRPIKKDLIKRYVGAQQKQNYLADSLEEFLRANKKIMSFKENKSNSDLRSIISKFETKLIEFVNITDTGAISVESLDQHRKSACLAKNIYSIGGLGLLFKNHKKLFLYVIIILLVVFLLFVFFYLYDVVTKLPKDTPDNFMPEV